MVSKYIKTIAIITEQPLTKFNKGNCVFNGVSDQPKLGNMRDCGSILCIDCIFSKNTHISGIKVIGYEQAN